jgi:preprotein translocase subunit SecY
MWLGEIITERGIGNGLSMIIFAGIVGALPRQFNEATFAYVDSNLPIYIALGVAAIVAIYGVIVVTEAERPIPVTYAKRVRGQKVYGGVSTYLPLRVNQAGVIPIIFALSLLLFPQMLFTAISGFFKEGVWHTIGIQGEALFANPWFYAVFYFILVFAFTYFYTAVTFDPHSLATNLQKNGAFIPGIRPGDHTADYISTVLTRITLVGALFLGFIAVLPLILKEVTFDYVSIGGTALLIVVSVVLDLAKKIDAQISMRQY